MDTEPEIPALAPKWLWEMTQAEKIARTAARTGLPLTPAVARELADVLRRALTVLAYVPHLRRRLKDAETRAGELARKEQEWWALATTWQRHATRALRRVAELEAQAARE